MSDSDSFVYIIAPLKGAEFVAPVKVGMSSSPQSRLETFQTAAPFRLGIYHAFAFPNREIAKQVEGAFHAVLKRHCSHGEWFNITPKAAFYHMAANLRAFLRTGVDMPEADVRPSIIYSIFLWAQHQ